MITKIIDFLNRFNKTSDKCFDNWAAEIDSLTKKYLTIYHNIPVGIMTISYNNHEIENYNTKITALLPTLQYPSGVGTDFKTLILKNDISKFDKWVNQFDENKTDFGVEVRLLTHDSISPSQPFWVHIHGLVISKKENIIIISLSDIDDCISIKKRIEEEKILIEENLSIKNKVFIDTYINLKKTLTSLLESDNSIYKTDIHNLIYMIDDVLNYYKIDQKNHIIDEKTHATENLIEKKIGEKFSKIKILIVEDNEINQNITEKLIYNFIPTAEIKIVGNGAAALECLKENIFDLVLMDLMMPIMDGYETVEKIRDPESEFYNPSIPIIALTATYLESDRHRAFNSGINDYLTKPIVARELIATIEKWM